VAPERAVRLLLDTHALVFLASDLQQLPNKAQRAIRAHPLFVSAISALEIGLLVKRARLRLPVAPAVFVERAFEQHCIEEIPIDRVIALHAATLPDLHNDPFDRLIVASATEHDLVIVTKDSVIPTYPGVRTVWD
jgi:PIN domain nuclease of toxin-antitoxin system